MKLERRQVKVTEAEVIKAVKKAPAKKSCGPDSITTLHLKPLGHKAVEMLTVIINKVVEENNLTSLMASN